MYLKDESQMVTISIPLSKHGKYRGKYVALVDEIDKDLAELDWRIHLHARTQYARRQSNIHLHRVILSRILGRELSSCEFTDHINGDGLDNRRENLRLATKAQNGANRGKQVNNQSGYKGVSWYKRGKKWHAQIMHNQKNIHLGYFDTPELAHEAYRKKAKELFSEFMNSEDK